MIGAVAAGQLGLLALSTPVGIVLFLLGFGVDAFFSFFPLSRGLGAMVRSSSNSATLIAIPFFVLLGEVLVRSGLAARTYAALDRWLSWLPGGLVHANIATATMFSTTSGSSVATAATVAMPQAETLGYDPRLFSGAPAASGTLGIMIPPSINLIVQGVLTQTSIPRLFPPDSCRACCWRWPSWRSRSRSAPSAPLSAACAGRSPCPRRCARFSISALSCFCSA